MKAIHLLPYLLAIVTLFFGVWLGYEWEKQSHTPSRRSPEEQRTPWKSGNLTSPLLECKEVEEEISIGDRAVLENAVVKYTDSALKEGTLQDIAVYFRDLNNGPWFGINERKKFTPGSLLKLPLAMSYYWKAQEDHHFLENSIEYAGAKSELATEATYGSDATLPPAVYTFKDLIDIMLRTSNNESAEILAQVLGEDTVLAIYKDLGIEPPQFGKDYEIDVKTFGAFFRVLYNASYVGERSSEDILSTLTQSTFKEGIVAGVPSSVLVAHKFGTRSFDGERTSQLHDCGIVYADSPYVLCIMTKGSQMNQLEHVIRDISKIVYEGVANE